MRVVSVAMLESWNCKIFVVSRLSWSSNVVSRVAMVMLLGTCASVAAPLRFEKAGCVHSPAPAASTPMAKLLPEQFAPFAASAVAVAARLIVIVLGTSSSTSARIAAAAAAPLAGPARTRFAATLVKHAPVAQLPTSVMSPDPPPPSMVVSVPSELRRFSLFPSLESKNTRTLFAAGFVTLAAPITLHVSQSVTWPWVWAWDAVAGDVITAAASEAQSAVAWSGTTLSWMMVVGFRRPSVETFRKMVARVAVPEGVQPEFGVSFTPAL